MQCPFCNAADTRVVDSRLAEEGSQVRRRRECAVCKGRFTTFERAALAMPNVVKRDGSPEPFDEDKLRRGMSQALFKRPVSADALDHTVENVMRKLRQSGEREVPSRQIGEWVMQELLDLDHVAYVRFASIYLSFEDVNAFREEIERLQHLPTAEQRKSQLQLIEPPDRAMQAADLTRKPPSR
ncbi:MAG: transcriptional regulator NrdR [Panacagrimonas sp.]